MVDPEDHEGVCRRTSIRSASSSSPLVEDIMKLCPPGRGLGGPGAGGRGSLRPGPQGPAATCAASRTSGGIALHIEGKGADRFTASGGSSTRWSTTSARTPSNTTTTSGSVTVKRLRRRGAGRAVRVRTPASASPRPIRSAFSSASTGWTRATPSKIGGTGLGLSIVKHGAQFHHARVSLDSEPGVGTTITISFPKEASNT